jgi:transcriptional regulator with XRE-family HTH domain
MEPLDKTAIGQRIKQLRKSRNLRQWQMAQMLGATQPAVHKYENGILPEVKRLLEIARIGNTSVEWILTGTHWENGSPDMERLEREVFDVARQIQSYSPEQRRALGAALEVLHAANGRLHTTAETNVDEVSDTELGRQLRAFQDHALEPLMAALAIYDTVVATISRGRVRDMKVFRSEATPEAPSEPRQSAHPVALRKNVG